MGHEIFLRIVPKETLSLYPPTKHFIETKIPLWVGQVDDEEVFGTSI
jgi:hypothetical protein